MVLNCGCGCVTVMLQIFILQQNLPMQTKLPLRRPQNHFVCSCNYGCGLQLKTMIVISFVAELY
jgi:hypothetical protein